MVAPVDHAGVIAPPPLLTAAAALAGVGLRFVWPVMLWPWGHAGIPTTACFFAALILAGAAAGRFWHAQTPVLPHRPTTALVTGGPYRLTRNPLYLSLGLVLAGVAFAMNSFAVFAMIAPWTVVMRYGVIDREERYLERKFGEDYRAYCRRVRRWL